MPFDGTTTAAATRSSFLDRMRRIFARTLPAPEPVAPQSNEVVQVLTIGRALIEDRKDWVQRRYETRDGRRCAVGALRGAARSLNLPRIPDGATDALMSVAMSRGFSDIESMNDNSRHRQMLSAFDQAIARARIDAQF